MYISGTASDYVNRMHQLPVSGADFAPFEAEGYNYTGRSGFNLFQTQKILQHEVFSKTASGFQYSQFFTGYRYFS